jgi:hypothetical protein
MRRKTETKIKGMLQDTQDPITNCKIYYDKLTGNILNSVNAPFTLPVPVLPTPSLVVMHRYKLTICLNNII